MCPGSYDFPKVAICTNFQLESARQGQPSNFCVISCPPMSPRCSIWRNCNRSRTRSSTTFHHHLSDLSTYSDEDLKATVWYTLHEQASLASGLSGDASALCDSGRPARDRRGSASGRGDSYPARRCIDGEGMQMTPFTGSCAGRRSRVASQS
jgi:hypothetical protein